MSPEQNIEQQNISPEQVKAIEKTVENSLDSSKIEQIPQPKAQEKIDSDQLATQQALISDDQGAASDSIDNEIIHKQVENILSDDMENVFLSLDSNTQQIFRVKGEETSKKITSLLIKGKLKAKEITNLILEWLRIIPQINKHYLEQEAKIKTDNILNIYKQK